MLPFRNNFVFFVLTVYMVYNCVSVYADEISDCKAEVQGNSFISSANKTSLFRCACLYKRPLGSILDLAIYSEAELYNCSPSMIKFPRDGYINKYLTELLLLTREVIPLRYTIAVPLATVSLPLEWCEEQK